MIRTITIFLLKKSSNWNVVSTIARIDYVLGFFNIQV